MNQSRLFVGNISYQAQEQDLEAHFSQAGVVTFTRIVTDRETGRSRGFAFVEYATSEEAEKAIEMFNQKEFDGRNLVVNIARPREDRH